MLDPSVSWDILVAGGGNAALYPPITADSPRELAGQLGLDPDAFARTVVGFNDAVVGGTRSPRTSRTATAPADSPSTRPTGRSESRPHRSTPTRSVRASPSPTSACA